MLEFCLHHLRCPPEDHLSMWQITKNNHIKGLLLVRRVLQCEELVMSWNFTLLAGDQLACHSHENSGSETKEFLTAATTFLLQCPEPQFPLSEESQMTPTYSMVWNRTLWNQNLLYCRVNLPGLCPRGKHYLCLPKRLVGKHPWNVSLKQKLTRHVEI